MGGEDEGNNLPRCVSIPSMTKKKSAPHALRHIATQDPRLVYPWRQDGDRRPALELKQGPHYFITRSRKWGDEDVNERGWAGGACVWHEGGIRTNKTRRHEVSMISAAQSSGDTRQK